MRIRFWVVLGLVLVPAEGCSKENVVDVGDEVLGVGQQCSGPEDTGCGEGSRCVLGFCRHGCSNDAECPRGTLCVGNQEPFGCTLPSEGACSAEEPCPEGLTCGLDGQCRVPCEADVDCPRNAQQCIAGACVSENESDYASSWGLCRADGIDRDGSIACADALNVGGEAGPEIMVCNVLAPGWASLHTCDTGYVCGEVSDLCMNGIVPGPPPYQTVTPACVPEVCDTVSAVCPIEVIACEAEPDCAACISDPTEECVNNSLFMGIGACGVCGGEVNAAEEIPQCP